MVISRNTYKTSRASYNSPISVGIVPESRLASKSLLSKKKRCEGKGGKRKRGK